MDPVCYTPSIVGKSCDFGMPVRKHYRPCYPDVRSFFALFCNSAIEDQACQFYRTSIENRNLGSIDFDICIVYPESGKCSKDVFNGSDFAPLNPRVVANAVSVTELMEALMVESLSVLLNKIPVSLGAGLRQTLQCRPVWSTMPSKLASCFNVLCKRIYL